MEAELAPKPGNFEQATGDIPDLQYVLEQQREPELRNVQLVIVLRSIQHQVHPFLAA